MARCGSDGCARRSRARNLCVPHYVAARRMGALPPLAARVELAPIRLTSDERHYLAGLFDGEGTICILRSGGGTTRRPTPKYELRVGVVMTHAPTVQRFAELFGGCLSFDRRHPKLQHKWSLGGWMALRVLVALGSALKVKRQQADVAAKFMDTYRGQNRGRNLVAKEIVNERMRLVDEMGALNDSHWRRKRLSRQ